MSKIPKKDIDRIFKDGSNRYDFPFNAEAWGKMEGMLNREKRRRVLIWWTVGILGILLLILLFWGLKSTSPSSPSDTPEVSGQAVANLDHETDTPARGETTILPGNAPPNQPAEEPKNSEMNSANIHSVDEVSNTLEERNETLRRAALTPSPLDRATVVPPGIEPIAPEGTPPVSIATDRPETTGVQEPASARQQTGRTERSPSFPDRRWETFHPVAVLEINPRRFSVGKFPADFPEVQSVVEAPKTTSRNRLLAGVTFSPEFNSVGYRDLAAVSWKWGVQLEYQYAGKFGFTSGVHRVNKKYRAGAGSYSPPKGFWTRKIAPIETDGECTVLEIPIGLTFYPQGYDQSGFFSEVGISSFLMVEEHYYYRYDVPDNDLVRYWGGENENQHWLGILNLSIGYNVILSDHLSARIAPYTQVPLTGLGHGQVKLTDLGAQFSFHYGLPGR